MMENAGRALAILTRTRRLGGYAQGGRVAVLAGDGGNGGGALTAARRLSTWGAAVDVLRPQVPDTTAEVPSLQLDILERLDSVRLIPKPVDGAPFDAIVDGPFDDCFAGARTGVPRISYAGPMRRPRSRSHSTSRPGSMLEPAEFWSRRPAPPRR